MKIVFIHKDYKLNHLPVQQLIDEFLDTLYQDKKYVPRPDLKGLDRIPDKYKQTITRPCRFLHCVHVTDEFSDPFYQQVCENHKLLSVSKSVLETTDIKTFLNDDMIPCIEIELCKDCQVIGYPPRRYARETLVCSWKSKSPFIVCKGKKKGISLGDTPDVTTAKETYSLNGKIKKKFKYISTENL